MSLFGFHFRISVFPHFSHSSRFFYFFYLFFIYIKQGYRMTYRRRWRTGELFKFIYANFSIRIRRSQCNFSVNLFPLLWYWDCERASERACSCVYWLYWMAIGQSFGPMIWFMRRYISDIDLFQVLASIIIIHRVWLCQPPTDFGWFFADFHRIGPDIFALFGHYVGNLICVCGIMCCCCFCGPVDILFDIKDYGLWFLRITNILRISCCFFPFWNIRPLHWI